MESKGQMYETKESELAGKTVALKDNVALAGVQCTNGTGSSELGARRGCESYYEDPGCWGCYN